MKNELENIVFSVLGKYKQNKLLVAVSGGADSMALLSSLCAFVPLCEVNVLHINHNLRGQESKNDAEFVRAFCEEYSIPCKIVTIPEGKIENYAKRHNTGIEAAARLFRRKALLREAHIIDTCGCYPPLRNPQTLILTAHTKDDALELTLMRILRGAGPAGLAGMPVKRGRFIRPLLEITREEIVAYLKEKNIPWREDSSNKDERFLRNKIRNKLIPFLNELQIPSRKGAETQRSQRNWKKGIENIAVTQALVAEFLNSEAERRIVWEEGRREKGEGKILLTDESNFFSQPQIIREEALFIAINNLCVLCVFAPPREVRRSVIRRFCLGEVKSCDLGRIRIIRKDGKIQLVPVRKDFNESGVSSLIN